MEQVFGGFWFWAIWTDLFGQGISPRHLACLASVLVCIFYLNLRVFFFIKVIHVHILKVECSTRFIMKSTVPGQFCLLLGPLLTQAL